MIQPNTSTQNAISLDPNLIEEFLADLTRRGRTEETLDTYRRRLEGLYSALPENKQIASGTLADVQERMLAEGAAPSTTNLAISVANSLLECCGRRELQLRSTLDGDATPPELSRTEYLRILSIARTLEKERTYLLVKVFACMGLFVHELKLLTVEAAEAGKLEIPGERTVRVPPCLRQELLDYTRKNGILHGPIFVTRTGRLMNRSNVSTEIQRLASGAQVDPEKCNPRCLRKLYQETQEDIRADMERLVERTYNRMLETEQATIGWNEGQG